MAQRIVEPETNGAAEPAALSPREAGLDTAVYSAAPAPPPRAGSLYPVIAIGLAVLAGILSFTWQRSIYRNITGDKEVVVATRALSAGTRLDEAASGGGESYRNVALATRPAVSLAQSKAVLTRLDQVHDKVVLYPVLPGEPIYAERLLTAADVRDNAAAAEGMPLAYTLSASQFSGGILPPLKKGDLVAVVSFNKRGEFKDFEQLLKSGEGIILAGRVVVGLPSTKKETPEWVSIAVTQEEAIKLAAALGSERSLALVKQRLE